MMTSLKGKDAFYTNVFLHVQIVNVKQRQNYVIRVGILKEARFCRIHRINVKSLRIHKGIQNHILRLVVHIFIRLMYFHFKIYEVKDEVVSCQNKNYYFPQLKQIIRDDKIFELFLYKDDFIKQLNCIDFINYFR